MSNPPALTPSPPSPGSAQYTDSNRTDNHSLHIREHRAVLDDPGARQNPRVVEATLAHLAEHEQLWMEVSMRPAILQATQQQPSPQQPQPQQGGNSAVTQQPGGTGDMPGMPGLPQLPPEASAEDQQAMQQLNLTPP